MQAPHLTHERPRCARCHYPMHPNRSFPGRYRCPRDLCNFCYKAASRTGEVIDFERTRRTRDELMHDWAMLRDEGYSKRQAAARLGMSLAAFDRAFHRARRAGDPRAVPARVVA